MPIVCPNYKMMYFPVPKNACSSIKNTLWVINNGSEFAPFTYQGKDIRNIHQIYVSMRFSLDSLAEKVPDWREYFRFAVVRDPVRRLVSAYRNRVLHHLELNSEIIEKSPVKSPDLVPRPDFCHFVRHLELYRKVSRSIAHHTDPQKVFLGDRLDFYDMVCSIEQIDELEAELARRLGRDVELPVLQNLGPKAEAITFDDNTRAAIRDFYREDYALLRGFYH